MSLKQFINTHSNKQYTNNTAQPIDINNIIKKDIKKNSHDIYLSIKIFEDIKKEVLNNTNINEFVTLVQWKHPEHKRKEIVGYLEHTGILTPQTKKESNKPNLLSKYTILRILHDIPVFVGHDLRNYKVNKGDIVSLPQVNARALIQRKIAAEINPAVAQ